MNKKLYGGIEAGGTKFVCLVGRNPTDVREETSFPTSDPENTLAQAVDFFQHAVQKYGQLTAIGVASFGPLELNPTSDLYGHITSTPKPGWSNTDVIAPLKKVFSIPIGFDTDVNGAALGEWRWGAAKGLDTFIYLTIGTGIGGGALVNGRLLHGALHPEMGHLYIPHDKQKDPFAGICPFHGDCFEGLASGPAIEKRWGLKAEELAVDHPAWELESEYIALGLVSYICSLSPERIILGGGVMHQNHLFPMIRKKVQGFLNDYIATKEITKSIDQFIVPPILGDRSGVLGAIALAEQMLHNS